MKQRTTVMKAIVTAALVAAACAEVFAFHDGGVGACEGCHMIHRSASDQDSGIPRLHLLKEQDAGSTCLICHQYAGDSGPNGFHVSTPLGEIPSGTPPKQLSPAGDFGWLHKSYSWRSGPDSLFEESPGERHGHNIVAIDYLYEPDVTNMTAPGGFYPSDRLGCISCHDPHGKYRRNSDGSVTTQSAAIARSGSFSFSPDPGPGESVGVYRLLGGRQYQPKSLSGNHAFQSDPPAAVAPAEYNRSEGTTQTRVAYGSGMSEWCRNCHSEIHLPASEQSGIVHPAGDTAKMGFAIADRYNSYVKTGDFSGTADASFLSLASFEEGTADYGVLKQRARSDDSFLAGPDSVAGQVMCLTCHRAHASGWDGMTRWNTRSDYIVYNGNYAQETETYQPYGQGRSEREARQAYYDRPVEVFAWNQDSLCNKCHDGL